MTEKDVRVSSTCRPNEMAPALAKGDVEAACVWQPLLDGLKKAAPDGKLLGTDMDTTELSEIRHHGVARHHDHLAQAGGASIRTRRASMAIGMFKGADYHASPIPRTRRRRWRTISARRPRRCWRA